MELIISVLIAGVIITFIAMPLFSAARAQENDATTALETLMSQRDGAYDALRDLDFDFQTGKLSETDYNSLRDKYKSRAAVILQQIDTTQKQSLEELEKEIAAVRARAVAPEQDDLEKEIAKRRGKQASPSTACKNCGTPFNAGDQFCAKCGNPL